MRGVARRAGGSPDICNANIRTVHIAIQCGLDPSDPVAPGFARIHRATSPINRGGKNFFDSCGIGEKKAAPLSGSGKAKRKRRSSLIVTAE